MKHVAVAAPRRRISSLESSAMESILSDLTSSQHSASGNSTGVLINTHESTFGKVFDKHCQTTTPLNRPTRQGSFLSSAGSTRVSASSGSGTGLLRLTSFNESESLEDVQEDDAAPLPKKQQQQVHRRLSDSPKRLRRSLVLRRTNAPMPQRQESIPCCIVEDDDTDASSFANQKQVLSDSPKRQRRSLMLRRTNAPMPQRQESIPCYIIEDDDTDASSFVDQQQPQSPKRHRRSLVLRKKNAPMPQRQESIPCLGLDSSLDGNGCTVSPVSKQKTSASFSILSTSQESSTRSMLSCRTFAEYSFSNQEEEQEEASGIWDLDNNSSWESFESLMDGSSILDDFLPDEEEQEESTSHDVDEDEALLNNLLMPEHPVVAEPASTSSSLSVGGMSHSHPRPKDTNSNSNTKRRAMMLVMGRRASSRKTRAPTSLSVSNHERRQQRCATNTTNSNRLVLVKSASARHMAVRRKWASGGQGMMISSASARHLSVHKEEQDNKTLTETSETTEGTEEEIPRRTPGQQQCIVRTSSGAGVRHLSVLKEERENRTLTTETTEQTDAEEEENASEMEALLGTTTNNKKALVPFHNENGNTKDDTSVCSEDDDDNYYANQSFCCRFTACTTRWFASRGKIN